MMSHIIQLDSLARLALDRWKRGMRPHDDDLRRPYPEHSEADLLARSTDRARSGIIQSWSALVAPSTRTDSTGWDLIIRQGKPAPARPIPADRRRFSYGGRLGTLPWISVWKFDVLLRADGRPEMRVTAYVKQSSRADALEALFARWPKATVFGTGLPLTDGGAENDLGRKINGSDIVVEYEPGCLEFLVKS